MQLRRLLFPLLFFPLALLIALHPRTGSSDLESSVEGKVSDFISSKPVRKRLTEEEKNAARRESRRKYREKVKVENPHLVEKRRDKWITEVKNDPVQKRGHRARAWLWYQTHAYSDEFREKRRKAYQKQKARPDYAERNRQKQRDRHARQKTDRDYKEKRKKENRESYARRKARPGFREKRRKQQQMAHAKHSADPEYMKRKRERQRRSYQRLKLQKQQQQQPEKPLGDQSKRGQYALNLP